MVAHSTQLSQSGGNGQSGNHNMYGEPPSPLPAQLSIGDRCIANVVAAILVARASTRAGGSLPEQGSLK